MAHAPLVGLIGASLRAALQLVRSVVANSGNSLRLTERMLYVGRLIARAYDLSQQDSSARGQRLRALFTGDNPTFIELNHYMAQARGLVAQYSEKRWWKAVMSNGSDRMRFEEADRNLQVATAALQAEIQLESACTSIPPPPFYIHPCLPMHNAVSSIHCLPLTSNMQINKSTVANAFSPPGSQEDLLQQRILAKVQAEWRHGAFTTEADVLTYLGEKESKGEVEELLALLPASDNVVVAAVRSSVRQDLEEIRMVLNGALVLRRVCNYVLIPLLL